MNSIKTRLFHSEIHRIISDHKSESIDSMTKETQLQTILRGYGKIALAYSGGIDSSFLLMKAKEILGADKVLAIIMDSVLIKPADTAVAIELAKKNGITYQVLQLDELSNPDIACYSMESWYHSKRLMYREMKRLAAENDIDVLVDGMIMDDLGDVRPGLRARDEAGVKSPLQVAGYYKSDIRKAAQEMEELNWRQPSSCSLFSRFPVGTQLTRELIQQVMESELFLESLGFEEVRVRYHGPVARIEVKPSQSNALLSQASLVSQRLQELGFTYVSLDLTGYRSGKMNATLKEKRKSINETYSPEFKEI